MAENEDIGWGYVPIPIKNKPAELDEASATSKAGKQSTNSLSSLTEPASKEINLSYPLDVENDKQQGHYIQFFILQSGQGKLAKAENKKLFANDTNKKAAQGMGMKVAATAGAAAAAASVVKFVEKNVNSNVKPHQSALSQGDPRNRILKSARNWTKLKQAITLYMPPSVKVEYKTEYNDTPISARAVAGAHAIEAFTVGAKPESLGGKAGKAAEAVVEGVALTGANFLMGAADTFAPGAKALAQISAGAVIGSKMELLFQGVGRRDFQYAFTFIPKSPKEAQAVAKIIYAFKFNMLPEYMGAKVKAFGKEVDLAKAGQLLTIPNAFDIQYMYIGNQNPWVNKISSCYLTNMSVEYGGDKFITYYPMTEPISGKKGPPPQRTVVSLSFSEIEILTRETVKGQGY